MLLTKLDRTAEAVKAYDAAIASQPKFAAAHFNKGFALEALGELDKAREAYESAVTLDATPAEPFARLASLAVRRGDYIELQRNAAQALSRNPNEPITNLALAAAELEKGALPQAEERIVRLKQSGLSDVDSYFASGLLGDVRDRQGHFDDAFRFYVEGNTEFRRASEARFANRRTVLDEIRWLTRSYTSGTHPLRGEPKKYSLPAPATTHVFLLGFIRSGTTLLEQVLTGHPSVVCMEEKEAFLASGRQFLNGPEGLERLASLPETDKEHYREHYWQEAAELGYRPDKKVFVDKHPFHTLKLPLIAALFPEAKIIFAIRDPRDVILSCLRCRFRMSAYTYELLRPEDAARFYAEYMNFAKLCRERLSLRILDVRHEDFVADFEAQARSICDFIGIEWTDSMRDFALRGGKRSIATPSARQIARGLSSEGIGRWRNYKPQLAHILPILQPWVEQFGYDID